MKVLKSGVEMTPEALSRLKGGACSCGCDYSAEMVHAAGSSYGSGCMCSCKSVLLNHQGGVDAATYL
jgi:hypothetical protein